MILNSRVEVSPCEVASISNVVVVSEPTAVAVPVIAPVVVFNESPAGSESPEPSAYVIVSPSGSVAVAGDSEYPPALSASQIFPRVPEAVVNAGSPPASNPSARIPESPDGFDT